MFKAFLKKWLFLVVVLAFSLVTAIRTSANFYYFFFWSLMAVAVVNLLLLLLEYFVSDIELSRSHIQRVEEDDTLEFGVKIKNKSLFPVFNFVLQDYLTCETEGRKERYICPEFLPGNTQKEVRYNVVCGLRGGYRIGPLIVYFLDPLGLFYIKKTYPLYSDVYVYPRTFPIHGFPMLTKGVLPWFGIETSRSSGDEDEFYGVREYKEGDSIKRIHWLSSAKKNRLVVKEYQSQSYYRVTILFNLEKDKNVGHGKESVVEYMIKIAASVAKYLTERGVSVEIIAHVGEIMHINFNKGTEHLEDILKFLACAKAESRVSLSEIFQEFSRFVVNDSSLIAIMSDQDWQYLPVLMGVNFRNVTLLPIVIMSSSFTRDVDKEKLKQEAQVSLAQKFCYNPILFCKGDNFQEIFFRYKNDR